MTFVKFTISWVNNCRDARKCVNWPRASTGSVHFWFYFKYLLLGLSLCCHYWPYTTPPAATYPQALLKSRLESKDDRSFVVRAPRLLGQSVLLHCHSSAQNFKLTRCMFMCVCVFCCFVNISMSVYFCCDSLMLTIWRISLLHRLSSLSTGDNSEDAEDTDLPPWLQWLTLIDLQVRANSWWMAAV